MKSHLPSGWASVQVGEIADVDIGFAFKSAEFAEQGIRLLRGENIEPGALRWTDTRYWPKSRLGPFGKLLVEPGDLILAMDRPVVSAGLKLARARIEDCPCVLVQRVARLRGRDGTTDILHRALSTPGFTRHILDGGQTGTQLPHISGKRIENFAFPLPPRGEQRRLADALDSYLTRLDAAAEGLRRVEVNLKRYRASVLKAAVEGRLVPTEAELAKREGRSYEPASELLASILKDRRRRWEEAELAKMKAKGESPKDETWKSRYQAPTAPDPATLPALPEGWCWTSLDALLRTPMRNGHSARESPDGRGIRTLTLTAVTDGDFSIDNTKVTGADPQKVADLWLEAGDILVERSNTPELVGTTCMYRGPAGFAIFPDLLIRVRTTSELSADFVEISLMSPFARQYFIGRAQGIAGSMPKVSQDVVASIPVPLPPAVEAARIASETARYLSVGSELAVQNQRDTAWCFRLRQSILTWAFEGKLVDQDPNDEPASVLLDRIRAQREAKARTSGHNSSNGRRRSVHEANGLRDRHAK